MSSQLRLSHAYSRHQLSDVAEGLCYLHFCNVIHGDLKGVRGCTTSRSTIVLTSGQLGILVGDSGHARIADFGLATVTQNPDSVRSVSGQHGHTVRWAAPEVLNEGIYSKEADIFSFAMVMIEVRHRRPTVHRALTDCCFVSIQVFTGAIPFSQGSSVMAVLAITQGRRPPRPTHLIFTESLWVLMQRCWGQDPQSRPEASEVLRVLITPSVSRRFPPSCIR